MRRAVAIMSATALAIPLAPPVAAVAVPVPLGITWSATATTTSRAPDAASRSSGTPVCVVDDDRLSEISGLAATRTGYVVVNDSSDQADQRKIFFLDRSCRVTRTVSYPSRPRDTEDLAVAPDGTIWVADIGDNDHERETVALWRLGRGTKRPTLHRLSYPDGAHDAEALVLTGDGTPVVVTKEFGGASLYVPASPLRVGGTVRLAEVGQVDLPSTITSNPFGSIGRRLVTGGATAPDGTRVVLRTYADAFEFDVAGGDVVKAITTGEPRVVPLPDEPQGESITYDTDGRTLLTVSESADQPTVRPAVLRYPAPGPPAGPVTPSGSPAPATTTGGGPPAGAPAGAPTPAATGGRSPAGRATSTPYEPPDRVLLLVVALAGITLLVAGAVAVVRISRRRW